MRRDGILVGQTEFQLGDLTVQYPANTWWLLRKRLYQLRVRMGVHRSEKLERHKKQYAKGRAALDKAEKEQLEELPPSLDNYLSEEYLAQNWQGYLTQLRNGTNGDTGLFQNTFCNAVRAMLASDNSIADQVDFGAFCGLNNHRLAREFPSRRFWAVDRGKVIKDLNEEMFSAPALAFVDDDIISFLEGQRFENGLLSHVRTACVLFPEKLRRLYRTAARQGIRYVLVVEHSNFSEELDGYYVYTLGRKPSAVYKKRLFIHNYPGLAYEAGYQPWRAEIIRGEGGSYMAFVYIARLS